MKRIFLLSLVALLTLPSLAQPKITCPIMDLSVSVKRCFVQGSNAYVDLILENTSTKDIPLWVGPERATDDEGCTYHGFYDGQRGSSSTQMHMIIDGKKDYNGSFFIPAEGFIRIRASVSELDEYANAFQFLSFKIDQAGYYSSPKILIIRNIPITRD